MERDLGLRVEVSPFTTLLRKGTVIASKKLPYPCEVTATPDNGLERARKLLEEDYALAILWNHISKRDGPALIVRIIFDHGPLNKRKVLVPIAYHQHGRITQMLATATNAELVPIVNRETIRKGKAKGKQLGYGKLKYAHEAIAILKQRGVVVLAPQGTRGDFSQNEHEIGKNLEFLFTLTDHEQFDKFALLFVGINIENPENRGSDELKGLNRGVPYNLRIGKCCTKEEARELAGVNLIDPTLEKAERSKLASEKYGNWACNEFGLLVPN